MTSSPKDQAYGRLGDELTSLGAKSDRRTFQPGQVIFSAGDAGDGFYVVESGSVRISAGPGPHEPRVLATIGPGDFFGEMAVIDASPRSATATAETTTTALFLDRAQLLRLFELRPPLALTLTREFSLRMRALNQKYVDDMIHAETLSAIGRFAGTIVHDFKNPLTVISMATELACFDHATPELRQQAKTRVLHQVERMTNMLQELIDVTKPTSQRPALELQPFATVMTPLIQELTEEMADRRVTVVVPSPPPAVMLPLDPQRWSWLLYNLCNNAADEMKDGGTIFLRFVASETILRIEVEDTGGGIAPEIARTLFQPFATHGKATGTGLGLSICKRIVEDHGGQIHAESAPGRGATFVITLPRNK